MDEAMEMNDLMIMLNARSLNLEMDSWEWKWNKDKKFSVKSFYNVLLKSHKEYVAPIDALSIDFAQCKILLL
ncbi:hypothetical protein FRX31_025906, partial [Thalictrum thalictroides]